MKTIATRQFFLYIAGSLILTEKMILQLYKPKNHYFICRVGVGKCYRLPFTKTCSETKALRTIYYFKPTEITNKDLAYTVPIVL